MYPSQYQFEDDDTFDYADEDADYVMGTIHEIGEISENQVAVAVLLEEGTVATGDVVHMGVDDNILAVTVAAIVSDGQLIGKQLLNMEE